MKRLKIFKDKNENVRELKGWREPKPRKSRCPEDGGPEGGGRQTFRFCFFTLSSQISFFLVPLWKKQNLRLEQKKSEIFGGPAEEVLRRGGPAKEQSCRGVVWKKHEKYTLAHHMKNEEKSKMKKWKNKKHPKNQKEDKTTQKTRKR